MWKRVSSIAGVTIRRAVRSQFCLALAGVLLLTLLGLLFTVQGDGTAAGRLRLLLTYGVGCPAGILGVASLWLACGSVAVDIEDRRLHLVAVKPVRAGEIWLGKWLGILAVNAALLAMTGGVLWLAAFHAGCRVDVVADGVDAVHRDVLTARTRIPAEMAGMAGDIEAEYRRLDAAGQVPTAMAGDEARQAIGRSLRAQRAVVRPGVPVTWEIDLPRRLPSGSGPGVLQYRLFSRLRDMPLQPAAWVFRDAGGGERGRVACVDRMHGVNRVEIQLSDLAGLDVLTAEYRLDPEAAGVAAGTVLFEPGREVELLVPAGTFGPNLVRALLLVFCGCALVAALGMTCGVLFSFPVAVFVAAAIAVVVGLGGSTILHVPVAAGDDHAHGAEAEPAPAWLMHASERTMAGIRASVAPLLRYRVRGRLADGLRIPWRETGWAGLVLVVLCGGVLGAIGSVALARRELAGGGR